MAKPGETWQAQNTLDNSENSRNVASYLALRPVGDVWRKQKKLGYSASGAREGHRTPAGVLAVTAAMDDCRTISTPKVTE